jgi:transcriptional regulator NrdR family protein
MLCPTCGIKLKCLETRAHGGSSTYRRYKCLKCDKRFSSTENLTAVVVYEQKVEKPSKEEPVKLSAKEIHNRLFRPARGID